MRMCGFETRSSSNWVAIRSTKPPRKLYVFLLNGHALGVDRAKIRIGEKVYQEGF